MEIKVDDLRKIVQVLLDQLAENHTTITLDKDFYWHIPTEFKYDAYISPPEFAQDINLGQLTDNWQELQKLLSNEAIPYPYMLVWLSAILRYIGEETPL